MSYEVKPTKVRESFHNEDEIELGSGNVFADLGLRNAEERLLKAKLATGIAQSIKKKGLSHAQTTERTGLEQPEICRVLRGQLSDFSAERLLDVLNRFNNNIEVRTFKQERAEGTYKPVKIK